MMNQKTLFSHSSHFAQVVLGVAAMCLLLHKPVTAQPLQFVDCYSGTLASGYTSGGTTLSITSATSDAPCTAVLPNGTSYYYLLVKAESTNTEEVFLVTSRSTTTLTVAGAQASRAASNHSSSARIIASVMTATAFTQFQTDVRSYRTMCNVVGSDNATSVLVNGDLGPQTRQYFVPAASTLVEITVSGDAGTPNVIPRRNRAGATVNFVSSALATASSGGIACTNTGGTTGLDGATTCSSTLQNTSLNAGDWLELGSGTAGGTAKRMSVCFTFKVN